MIIEYNQDYPPLDEQYYHHQIIGLQVRTTCGELLGQITGVISGRSNDNYIVQGTNREILIPAIEDVVKAIDLDRGCMTIEAIAGLLELNEKTR